MTQTHEQNDQGGAVDVDHEIFHGQAVLVAVQVVHQAGQGVYGHGRGHGRRVEAGLPGSDPEAHIINGKNFAETLLERAGLNDLPYLWREESR